MHWKFNLFFVFIPEYYFFWKRLIVVLNMWPFCNRKKDMFWMKHLKPEKMLISAIGEVSRTHFCICPFDSPWSITYNELFSVFSSNACWRKKNDFLSQTCYAFFSKWFFLFLPVRASLISPPDLMIQILGWCQNVANTCRYNLTESDFLFSISWIQKENIFWKICPNFSNFCKKNFP